MYEAGPGEEGGPSLTKFTWRWLRGWFQFKLRLWRVPRLDVVSKIALVNSIFLRVMGRWEEVEEARGWVPRAREKPSSRVVNFLNCNFNPIFNSRELICFLPDENKLRSASLCQLSNLCLATRTTTSFIQRYTVYNDLRSYHRINSPGFQFENVLSPMMRVPRNWHPWNGGKFNCINISTATINRWKTKNTIGDVKR